jgi:hypothetical protein
VPSFTLLGCLLACRPRRLIKTLEQERSAIREAPYLPKSRGENKQEILTSALGLYGYGSCAIRSDTSNSLSTPNKSQIPGGGEIIPHRRARPQPSLYHFVFCAARTRPERKTSGAQTNKQRSPTTRPIQSRPSLTLTRFDPSNDVFFEKVTSASITHSPFSQFVKTPMISRIMQSIAPAPASQQSMHNQVPTPPRFPSYPSHTHSNIPPTYLPLSFPTSPEFRS